VSPRLLALLLLAAAALLHAGVGLPAAARARAASEEYARVRDDRREAQAQLAAIALRRQARARALAALDVPAPAPEQAAARLRSTLAAALRGQGVSDVRFSVRAGKAPVSALARVMAKGSYADVMELSERLLAPETGLVVEQASFRTGADGVDLELELASLGGRP
jgi:hypothetical protein